MSERKYSFLYRSKKEEQLIENVHYGLETQSRHAIDYVINQLLENVSSNKEYDVFTPDELAEVIHNSILVWITHPIAGGERPLAVTIDRLRSKRP